MRTASVKKIGEKWQQEIQVGPHRWLADVTPDLGGEDGGPSPHDLLYAALAACTAMTVQMFAQRKQWPLEDVQVSVTGTLTPEGEKLKRQVRFVGNLESEQRQRLAQIADKCPVHKLLINPVEITTEIL